MSSINLLDSPLLLRRLADAIERLSADEQSRLLDTAYEIELRPVRRRQKSSSIGEPELDISRLVSDLSAFDSRERALHHLIEVASTRVQVERVARFLDIPIAKHDKVEMLRDRVIEATVGSRLRSIAIKGTE